MVKNLKVNISELKGRRIALVLSGGVVKAAAWHLGVALALEEIGFCFRSINSPSPEEITSPEISTYVGSSAGSMVNVFLALGLTPNDVINSTLQSKKSNLVPLSYADMLHVKLRRSHPIHKDFFNPYSEFPLGIRQLLRPILSFPGLFSTEGLVKYLTKNVLKFNTFEELNSDLFIVATQLDHSRKVIFSKYNYPNPSHDSTAVYYTGASIADATAASMSVPPFYIPYPIYNGHTKQIDYYIDGEIRETLSTHVAEDNKCEYVISSWTHTPYHYHDEVGSLINYGLPAICLQSIYLMIQKKIVTHRAARATARDILNTVNDYMLSEKFTNFQRKSLLAILERKLNFNPKTKLIDIYPDHSDYKLFFGKTFSLNPKVASHAVQAGYRKTLEVFSRIEI